jgi:hypothetical protein
MNWLRRESGRQVVPLYQRLGSDHSGGDDGVGDGRPRSPFWGLVTVTAVAVTPRVCNTGAQIEPSGELFIYVYNNMKCLIEYTVYVL